MIEDNSPANSPTRNRTFEIQIETKPDSFDKDVADTHFDENSLSLLPANNFVNSPCRLIIQIMCSNTLMASQTHESAIMGLFRLDPLMTLPLFLHPFLVGLLEII